MLLFCEQPLASRKRPNLFWTFVLLVQREESNVLDSIKVIDTGGAAISLEFLTVSYLRYIVELS